MSGSVGWTTRRAICPASGSPAKRHERPPSVERQTPWPGEVLPRMSAEPVPTQTTFGSESATSTAPTEPPKKPSLTLRHDVPASSVFQTPPPVAPMKKVCGSPAIPATAVERPPRKGPSRR
jgi:hypothetical protein